MCDVNTCPEDKGFCGATGECLCVWYWDYGVSCERTVRGTPTHYAVLGAQALANLVLLSWMLVKLWRAVESPVELLSRRVRVALLSIAAVAAFEVYIVCEYVAQVWGRVWGSARADATRVAWGSCQSSGACR